jgi:hypothetical protein
MTSRKILLPLLTVALLPAAAVAQPPPPPPPPGGGLTPAPAAAPGPSPIYSSADAPMLLGADFELAVPIGNLSDGAGLGFGALIRFEYGLMPKLNLTGRAGYIHFLGKDRGVGTASFRSIPVLAGAKYDITDIVYLAGELGISNNGVSADIDLGPMFGGKQTVSNNETDVALTIGAGMRFGDIDARAGLMFLDIGHAGDSTAIGINVGYNFWHK